MTTQDVWDDGRQYRALHLLVDVLGAGLLILLSVTLQSGHGTERLWLSKPREAHVHLSLSGFAEP